MAGDDIGRSRPEALGAQESPAVKSALKATLDRELARQASMPSSRIGGAATPEHTASPGRRTP